MNNKGFSLIELIVAIGILAVLTLVLVPSISSIMQKNKEDSYLNLIENIKKAASIYVSDNRYDSSIIPINCSTSATTFDLTLQTLIESGDLSSPIIDPRDKTEISTTKVVTVMFDCNTREFSYEYQE